MSAWPSLETTRAEILTTEPTINHLWLKKSENVAYILAGGG